MSQAWAGARAEPNDDVECPKCHKLKKGWMFHKRKDTGRRAAKCNDCRRKMENENQRRLRKGLGPI